MADKKLTETQAFNPESNISEPFQLKIGKMPFTFAFKELTEKQESDVRLLAERKVAVKKLKHDWDLIQETGIDKEVSMASLSLWDGIWEGKLAEQMELSLLAMALVNPESGERLYTEKALEDFVTPSVKSALIVRYTDFAVLMNPDRASDDLIDELLDGLKKNTETLHRRSLATQYSLETILACLFHTIDQLTSLPDDSDSGNTLEDK